MIFFWLFYKFNIFISSLLLFFINSLGVAKFSSLIIYYTFYLLEGDWEVIYFVVILLGGVKISSFKGTLLFYYIDIYNYLD